MSVCRSVRLFISSHAGILSKRLYISSNFFSLSGSPAILVFCHTKRDGNTLTGSPLTGASNARGMKNHDVRPIARFISEMIQDRAIFTMADQ